MHKIKNFIAYVSIYVCALRNFLYNGVSNKRHNCNPLSNFKIALFVAKAALINFELIEFSHLSSFEKLFSLISKTTKHVTKIKVNKKFF